MRWNKLREIYNNCSSMQCKRPIYVNVWIKDPVKQNRTFAIGIVQPWYHIQMEESIMTVDMCLFIVSIDKS